MRFISKELLGHRRPILWALRVCMTAFLFTIPAENSWADTAGSIPGVERAKDEKLAVTVYNGGIGVVRETRTLTFEKGQHHLSFRDVPSSIDATSVGFRATPLNRGSDVKILEQNYQYDLVSPEKIYERYIDKTVELISKSGKIYSGTLLSPGGGSVTLSDKSGAIQIVQMGEIASVNFPQLPEGLITRPTLNWEYSAGASGAMPCEVSYQTAGLNWTAEYVGTLDSDEKNLTLAGWASIQNNSGKTYKDATLKLVAGDIHRALPPRGPMYKGRAEAMEMAIASTGFEEKAFFEYHLYTLPRLSTLTDNEIKQISLFEPGTTPVSKEYYFASNGGEKNIDVKLVFTNSKKAGLGMALPAGRVRVFKADTDGSMILLGEDNINHTPQDEEITLTVGQAFDLVGEETTLDHRSISQIVSEVDYQVSLRNRKKDQAVTIHVQKALGGFWEITNTSHPFVKKSATMAQWDIPVSAGAEAKLAFTVRNSNR